MKSVYVSSTVEDLKDHRRAVSEVLRNAGYNVESMEKYPARDDRPKSACEADAANCDLYVGIFGWRYGHIPAEDNPERKSITELEYLAAKQKPRLVFLRAEDGEGLVAIEPRIRELRERLDGERWSALFTSADDLAKNVLLSVIQHEATKRVESLAAIEEIKTAVDIGTSYLPNIQQQIEQLGSVDFVAVRLSKPGWWNTRLHLAAALASDFTDIRQFVILDAQGRFLAMAPPSEIRRALAKSLPKLEMVYLEIPELAREQKGSAVAWIVSMYPGAVMKVFSGQAESAVKQLINAADVRELGLKSQGEMMEQFTPDQRLAPSEILRRHAPYVVLFRDGVLEGVVDRLELSSRMAAVLLR